jgi:predicted adenylyl cyclase CyaB
MPIEVEKKYRLTKTQRDRVMRRLRELKARRFKEEFEENTIYRGGALEMGKRALRLRRVGDRATLTFKERFPGLTAVKHQLEEETQVADAEVIDAILQGLGFEVALVYEKRRLRWKVGRAEVALDELPFGLFMEIEASEAEIARVEELLNAARLPAESETYPTMTVKLGKLRDGVIEARFRGRKK